MLITSGFRAGRFREVQFVEWNPKKQKQREEITWPGKGGTEIFQFQRFRFSNSQFQFLVKFQLYLSLDSMSYS